MPVDLKRPGGLLLWAFGVAIFAIGISVVVGTLRAKELFGVPGRVALIVIGAGIGAVSTTLATFLVIQDAWRKNDGNHEPSHYPVATRLGALLTFFVFLPIAIACVCGAALFVIAEDLHANPFDRPFSQFESVVYFIDLAMSSMSIALFDLHTLGLPWLPRPEEALREDVWKSFWFWLFTRAYRLFFTGIVLDAFYHVIASWKSQVLNWSQNFWYRLTASGGKGTGM